MRVRVLKDFAAAGRTYHAGETVDIDPRKAEGWLRAGLIMQDKSLDGGSETKASPPKSKSKRRTK